MIRQYSILWFTVKAWAVLKWPLAVTGALASIWLLCLVVYVV